MSAGGKAMNVANGCAHCRSDDQSDTRHLLHSLHDAIFKCLLTQGAFDILDSARQVAYFF